MIFEHFVQIASDTKREDGGDERENDTGLAQAGAGRGIAFARRMRATLAEAAAKVPNDDTATQQGIYHQQEEDDDNDDQAQVRNELSGAASPGLSRTRSHRKRSGGAYGDQTRTGYVNTFSSVR